MIDQTIFADASVPADADEQMALVHGMLEAATEHALSLGIDPRVLANCLALRAACLAEAIGGTREHARVLLRTIARDYGTKKGLH